VSCADNSETDLNRQETELWAPHDTYLPYAFANWPTSFAQAISRAS